MKYIEIVFDLKWQPFWEWKNAQQIKQQKDLCLVYPLQQGTYLSLCSFISNILTTSHLICKAFRKKHKLRDSWSEEIFSMQLY